MSAAIAMSAEDFDMAPARSAFARFALGVAALLAAAAGTWAVFHVTGNETVARLRIEGRLQRVDIAEVDAAVRPLVDMRFIDVDLLAVQTAVEALPWVARVRAEREWPATVRLRMWEREPQAYWGNDRLLDSDAVAFTPAGRSVPESLPRLSGPPGSEALLLNTYRRLSARLEHTPFALAALNRDARGDWTGTTAGDIELRFGRSDPTQTLDMLLGPARQALSERLEEVKHVDLRYTNGFSVGWREPVAGTKRN